MGEEPVSILGENGTGENRTLVLNFPKPKNSNLQTPILNA